MNFILLTALFAILTIQMPIIVKAQPVFSLPIPSTPAVADPREIFIVTQLLNEVQTLSDNIKRLLLVSSTGGNNRNDGAGLAAIIAALFAGNRGNDDYDRQPSIIKVPGGSYKGSYARSGDAAASEQASEQLKQYFNDLLKKKVNKRSIVNKSK
jgi:hypothetical protein